ncbi:acyltransferase [Dysgonomonas sp.]
MLYLLLFFTGILPNTLNKVLYKLVKNIGFGKIGGNLRYAVIKRLAKECGNNIYIGPNVIIVHIENLSIGNNVSIHANTYIDCTGTVTIGNDVSIAHDCSIISFEHIYTDKNIPIRDQPLKKESIIISNNSWLGCKVCVLAGVKLGERMICAAGSVICNSFENGHAIIGGVPAKLIKQI